MIPVPDAFIRIYKIDKDEIVYEDFFMSDALGKTMNIPLYTPSIQLSFDEDALLQPYETYHIEVRKNGYQTCVVKNLQLFADEKSYIPIALEPTVELSNVKNTETIIEDHPLYKKNMQQQMSLHILPQETVQLVIPDFITVHLGKVDEDVENLTIAFIDYLKNCASTQLYPSWPYEALKANILILMSNALHCIVTKWYHKKGYCFDITAVENEQRFMKNRNIYHSIATIVDEVYGQFIQKQFYPKPYDAQICNSNIENCIGMKRWESVQLANEGYTALRILQRVYGSTIEIADVEVVQNVLSRYPEIPMRVGSSGQQVAQLQEQLQVIKNYQLNLLDNLLVDGIYGADTEKAVRNFQNQFNLNENGIVDKATFYKVAYTYAFIYKLEALKKFKLAHDISNHDALSVEIKEGIYDDSNIVKILQFYLNVIAIFYHVITPVEINGKFDETCLQSVKQFQRHFNIACDGVVGVITWQSIHTVYHSIKKVALPLEVNKRNKNLFHLTKEELQELQSNLNILSNYYRTLLKTAEDGIMGKQTKKAVIAFQKLLGLQENGIIDFQTKVLIQKMYQEVKHKAVK